MGLSLSKAAGLVRRVEELPVVVERAELGVAAVAEPVGRLAPVLAEPAAVDLAAAVPVPVELLEAAAAVPVALAAEVCLSSDQEFRA